MASKSAPPMPWTMAPMFWLRRPSGLTMAPDSQACDDADDVDFLGGGIDGHFGAGGDVAAFLHAAGEAEAAGGCGFGWRPSRTCRRRR